MVRGTWYTGCETRCTSNSRGNKDGPVWGRARGSNGKVSKAIAQETRRTGACKRLIALLICFSRGNTSGPERQREGLRTSQLDEGTDADEACGGSDGPFSAATENLRTASCDLAKPLEIFSNRRPCYIKFCARSVRWVGGTAGGLWGSKRVERTPKKPLPWAGGRVPESSIRSTDAGARFRRAHFVANNETLKAEGFVWIIVLPIVRTRASYCLLPLR